MHDICEGENREPGWHILVLLLIHKLQDDYGVQQGSLSDQGEIEFEFHILTPGFLVFVIAYLSAFSTHLYSIE